METSPLVLVINDVPPMVRLIELELGFQGMRTQHVLVDEQPVERAEQLRPDAIVLGSVLPTPHQFDILFRLSAGKIAPVVFINASGLDADTTLALEMGAAEVVSKPFSPDDLALRLRSLMGQSGPDETQIRRGNLRMDILRRSVWNADRPVPLGASEWGLLLALASTRGPITATDLLTTVWGEAYAQDQRFLRIWIDRLRANLGDDVKMPSLVLGDLEHGYQLAE